MAVSCNTDLLSLVTGVIISPVRRRETDYGEDFSVRRFASLHTGAASWLKGEGGWQRRNKTVQGAGIATAERRTALLIAASR